MFAILTYDAPHRKTQDLLFKMACYGLAKDALLIATPWSDRNNFKPLFAHRPENNNPTGPERLAEVLGCRFLRATYDEIPALLLEKGISKVVIAGAGIVPGLLTDSFQIINAHPGFLPYSKGLDALKWAILEDLPIGITIHLINSEVDEGILIEKQVVPLYFEDTFTSLANRIYDVEIELLAKSPISLDNLTEEIILKDDTYMAHRRMPHHLELKMMEKFNALRIKAPSRFEN